MNRKPIYSWDATVFIAWLKEEESPDLVGIDLVANLIDAGEVVLVVSVTAYSEVLETQHSPEQMDKFRRFLDRSNIVLANTTTVIAERAGTIRARGQQDRPNKRQIKTPDATFLAAAIIHKADEFHTLDDQLLKLNGLPIVDGLKICKPAVKDSLFGNTADSK